jgi:hypothetical protein
MAFTLAAALQAAAAVATVASAVEGREAAKAAERAAELERRQQEQDAAKARRQVARKQLVRQAQLTNVAAQTGAADTSAFLGAVQSQQSQAGSQLAAIEQASATRSAIFAEEGRKARAQARGALFGAAGQVIGGNLPKLFDQPTLDAPLFS